MNDNSHLHHLFWTGGWDSTFRLLQLLIVLKEPVQPHYMIDAERESTGAELYTHSRIKKALLESHPQAAELLLPVKLFEVSDLPAVHAIRESYQRLRKDSFLGSQYRWLPEYAAMAGLENVEVSVTLGGRFDQRFRQMTQTYWSGTESSYRMDQVLQSSDEYSLLGYFSFPLLDYTKIRMQEEALAAGFQDLMHITWFCHHPLPNFTPCGVCNPCSFVIQQGLGWRIPLHRRIRYYLPGRAMLVRLISQNVRLYRLARQIKDRISPAKA